MPWRRFALSCNESDSPVSEPFADAEFEAARRLLRERIEETVRLEPSAIQLGGREMTWLRVANPDVLLEHAVEQDQVGHEATVDPFWAATWRAALGLDRFLEAVVEPGLRVLELGCGSGQAGTAAAIRGASVLSTDSVDLALHVAELNAWDVRERIRFQTLVWGRDQLAESPFPVIIGSDLVYDPSRFEDLFCCIGQHLAKSGRVYLSEPHRHSGDKFSVWVKQQGWKTEEHDVDLGDERVPVRIFECWKEG
ncbi:MAG: 50S ribosomal protein L11 methyltransferase [Planctomycetota bacterium]